MTYQEAQETIEGKPCTKCSKGSYERVVFFLEELVASQGAVHWEGLAWVCNVCQHQILSDCADTGKPNTPPEK